MKKKKFWVRKRHAAIFAFLRVAMAPLFRLKYHYRAEKAPIKKGPCVIMCNHQATMDPFFVSKAFRFPIYFVASDDLFNLKVSPLIRYLAAPIPKSKSLADLSTVRTALRILREGGSVGMAPEGNRTFSGRQWEIYEATAKFVKLSKVPLVLFNLCGGYGTDPRWGHSIRRGSKYVGRVKRIVSPEEYEKMTNEELLALIKRELDVNDAASGERYKSRKRAEYIERALYMCPVCGKVGGMTSKGTHFSCRLCGSSAEYTEELSIQPPFGGFTKVYDWYYWERAELPPRILAGECVEDTGIRFFDSLREKKKVQMDGHSVRADREGITVIGEKGEHKFAFADMAGFAAVGKKKFNFYYKGKTYQVKGHKRFCAVKYLHIYQGVKAAQKHAEEINA